MRYLIFAIICVIIGYELGAAVFRPDPEYVQNDAIPAGDYLLDNGHTIRHVHVQAQDYSHTAQMIWNTDDTMWSKTEK